MFASFALFVCCLVIGGDCTSSEEYLEEAPWVPYGNQSQNLNYEVRCYNASKWVSASIEAFSEYEAAEIGFDLVYRYINGSNSEGRKLNMTTPFTIQEFQSNCIFCLRSFTISYFIPREYQNVPVIPSNSKLRIVEKPTQIIYARRIDSYERPLRFRYEANSLYHHLVQDNITEINQQTVLFATYDPPFRTFSRNNQVWLFPNEVYEYENEFGLIEETEEHYYYYT